VLASTISTLLDRLLTAIIINTGMLKDRQKLILNALIAEYISSAEPVASRQIVDKFRFPFSSATVRSELLALDEEGYLEQPHTSAGRVPTDKGYRFFISEVFDSRDPLSERHRALLSELFKIDRDEEFLRQIARTVSELSESFTIAGLYGDELFYKAGIAEAFREPEFDDRSALKEFSELADFIDEEIRSIFEPGDFKKPKAFIGHENPIKEARNYGMIVSSVETPHKKETLVAILGPKRMDYRKNISLLEYLDECCF